jgi:hypothetical protein
MVRSEGICHWKIQWPPGIVTLAVLLVAHCLNHYATPGPIGHRVLHRNALCGKMTMMLSKGMWFSDVWQKHNMIRMIYRGAGKSLARPTLRCILFDGENFSFDASLVIYINSTNIPPIMIRNRIYEHKNLLSLYLVCFLVGLRTYQHPCRMHLSRFIVLLNTWTL